MNFILHVHVHLKQNSTYFEWSVYIQLGPGFAISIEIHVHVIYTLKISNEQYLVSSTIQVVYCRS